LVFAHANGYPPGSYRQFFEPFLDSARLTAYLHRPMWSSRVPRGRLSWAYLAEDLIHTLQFAYDKPVWLMGHSMGAVIGMIAASKAPGLFHGLILIDPPFFPTRHSLGQRLSSRAKLRSTPIVHKALNRPNTFSDHQEAFDFHRAKRPFSAISDEGLWDYIHAGTRPAADGGLELSYPREWEAAVYASAPFVWLRIARLRLPTLGLRGRDSMTLSPDIFRRWQRLQPNAEMHTCPGGHLLPVEHPLGTASYVIDFLSRQAN
jgi:pimeloyl-ACP methyl ester carboxylesterase